MIDQADVAYQMLVHGAWIDPARLAVTMVEPGWWSEENDRNECLANLRLFQDTRDRIQYPYYYTHKFGIEADPVHGSVTGRNINLAVQSLHCPEDGRSNPSWYQDVWNIIVVENEQWERLWTEVSFWLSAILKELHATPVQLLQRRSSLCMSCRPWSSR